MPGYRLPFALDDPLLSLDDSPFLQNSRILDGRIELQTLKAISQT
jgi:hypothetical protein